MLNPDVSESPSGKLRWRLGCGCLGVLMLLVITPVLIWQLDRGRAGRQVKREIARLRAAGQPVTTIDINSAYKPAEGRPDMTLQLLVALALCERKDLKEAGQSFPLVGTSETGPPLPGQPWEERAAIEEWLGQHQEALDTFHTVYVQHGTARYTSDYRRGFATL